MTYRKWIVVGVALGLVGALVAGLGLGLGTFSAPGYVRSHYARAKSQDIGRDGIAYTSKQPPSRVAQDLTRAFRPGYRYVDGSGHYLRYDDDSVVILPLAAGSLILLENISTAHGRYHSRVGNSWGTVRGNTGRGGGPGAGK